MRKIKSRTKEETRAIGSSFAKEAGPGTVIALFGDLGAGKTEFAKGIAEGLGITEPVTSPTFTILQIYEGGRLPLYHFDLYRLADEEELFEIGFDEFRSGRGICVIEWADRFPELFADALRIRIERIPEEGEDARLFTVEDPV